MLLQLLEAASLSPASAILYVISDGENNAGNLETSIKNAEQKRVTIHTIAISQAADSKMQEIAHRTGGKAFSYLEILNGSVGLAASFLEAAGSSVTAQNSAPATVRMSCVDFLDILKRHLKWLIQNRTGQKSCLNTM